tara:strand:+ start:172 stop:675 length:504 start_codon:yes stop_codon:yes gene_type:complete
MKSNLKLIAHKRINYPTHELLGNIKINEPKTFNGDLHITLDNRTKHGLAFEYAKLEQYDQSSITNDPDWVKELISITGEVNRLRWSKLNANKELDWHIDPADWDRFVINVNVSSICEIKTHKETISFIMKPGEIWYLNTSWSHRIINNNPINRVALLGNFTREDQHA